MTIVLAALAGVLAVANAATVAGFLLARERDQAREHEQRQEDRGERAFLLQRIQAPQVAVAQFDPSPDEPADTPLSEEELRVFHSEQDEILHNSGRL